MITEQRDDSQPIAPDDLCALLMHGARERRCGLYLHYMEPINRLQIYVNLEAERLRNKAARIMDLYKRSMFDWNQLFLIALLDSISDMENRPNYVKLGNIVPIKLLQRERLSLRNVEALLIGASGLLDLMPNDRFIKDFRKSAEFQMHKHQIKPIDARSWNMRKIFPVKHPIVRLSQVAHIICENEFPFNRILECRDRNDILHLFAAEASQEWCQRLKLKGSSHIGVAKADLLGINFVVPLLYSYGLSVEDNHIFGRARELNEALPVESNHYITSWRKWGLTPNSAYESQALIQLAKCYCDCGRCLECSLYEDMLSPRSILPKLPIFLEHQR